MGEEFQTGICGGNLWWNINNMNSTTRSVFPLMISSSSPCSVAANNDARGIGYSAWQTDTVDLKATTTTSCSDHTNNMVSESDSSLGLGFLDATKPLTSEAGSTGNNNGGGAILMDSTLQMMGFGHSSNWNHSLFSRCSGRPGEGNFHNSMLQEETGMESCGNSQSQDQKRTISMNDGFNIKQMKQQDSCGGFPVGYPSSSTLIQSLYDIPQPQAQAQSLFTNPISSMAYSSTPNYGAISCNELLSPTTSWSKASNSLLKSSGLHFSNTTPPFWNASAEALHDMRAGVFAPSSQPQQYHTSSLINEKPNFPSSLITKPKREEAPDSASVKKSSCEPATKRQRIETPSPLPAFKVRKEKLGDRITALQQLVSPFGKTDTASVLHEAIEYIKFLHDQVSVLCAPYMKNGAPTQQGSDAKDSDGPKQDLRSRGLCLVPISSTFPVTNETSVDFWTPSIGGALLR